MRAYMKSEMPCLGVRMAELRRIVRAALSHHPPADRTALLGAAAELWRRAQFREHRYAATELLASPTGRRMLDLGALGLLEEMIRTGAWWDHVDPTAHLVGSLLGSHRDEMTAVLGRWKTDPDRWIRRVTVICQLGRKGATDVELLESAIAANAVDPDFFLRKAIGWALRDYARTDPGWVLGLTRRVPLSKLSVREALRHIAPA